MPTSCLGQDCFGTGERSGSVGSADAGSVLHAPHARRSAGAAGRVGGVGEQHASGEGAGVSPAAPCGSREAVSPVLCACPLLLLVLAFRRRVPPWVFTVTAEIYWLPVVTDGILTLIILKPYRLALLHWIGTNLVLDLSSHSDL